MIVGTCFEDDSVEAGWIQHDVYSDALRIIRTECQDRTGRADALGKSLMERYADVRWSDRHRVQYLVSQ